MRQALDKTLRKKLEDTVVKARDIVEQAVFEALQRLGVAEAHAPNYLNDEERALRNKLRAHARQLGDKLDSSPGNKGKQETERLINEMAYEHWHRMLFARYLEQNNLLMYDEYTPVTLDECFELAEEEPDCKDGWELAGRLAQKMLPQIFRVDSPVFDIKLSMNRVEELESLIAQLDSQTYQAQDSLGWCYQFWQTKKKDQVNKSGVKIGAQELSPVTQLFTEPYMVSFLLDNALGAWWANKRLSQDDLIRANNEQELRELAAIPGVPLEYLRFSKEEEATQWKPAAGGFEKWPEHLSEFKTLDPCCGSGHFLVAVFLMLVPMRMQLEGLSEKQAVDAVLRDNIHGLELDQRCVELAAFALALEAWRYPNAGGYRALPELQLACSGMSIAEAQKEWKDLAKGDEALTDAITWMQDTFKYAPTLGSLIDPVSALKNCQTPPWEILINSLNNKANVSNEAKTSAKGLAKSAEILAEQYTWVMTNVPYLSSGKQSKRMIEYCGRRYPNSKNDLATVFLEKSMEMLVDGGATSVVMPQNWLFLTSYMPFRKMLLKNTQWSMVARLGTKSFQTPMWDFNVQLLSLTKLQPKEVTSLVGTDVSEKNTAQLKSEGLKLSRISSVLQSKQLENPDIRIGLEEQSDFPQISTIAECYQGLVTGDIERFTHKVWEIDSTGTDWQPFRRSNNMDEIYGNVSEAILWEGGEGELDKYAQETRHQLHDMHESGNKAWGKLGIAVNRMASLKAVPYFGEHFDNNVAVIYTEKGRTIDAGLYCYLSSDDFEKDVRKLDQAIKVTNKTFLKIAYNSEYWNEVSKKEFPNGIVLPYSNNSTQWIFHGHPCASVIWDEESKTTTEANLRQDDTVLQVAAARLLGYQWPAELDPEMELAPEMREVMKKNADFAGLIDDDGIVCIPAVRGEKTAAKRLEAILHKAYCDEWTSSIEQNLLKAVKAKDLESWLRDKFFDQHSKLFQHRPFIWQVWDGLKDGFSALVNYHKLDYKGLERLIYTYLDDWISTQKRDLADGKDGADIRLTAAENLKTQLEAILAGEKGLDIFVRWKPLEEQPIGWNPDLNDGVRLNIRPFMLAKDVGKKGAGVLRGKPNIHWKKDRGTDVASAPWFDLGPVYGESEGSRINDHHLTLAEKKAAREAKESLGV
ncbi:Eco57I restriction-modification methylase domain-containing protein [Enterovibrio norvegicus]|uniref:Eco57I restriction-modification methylase domain-containing protein n=1 Tax=Enterovibrio norvegicus TaxID=188144 RepID=UPI000C82B9B6|nr:N-6 DNA methylase [Enterovibrio norvegicus]PMH64398.1 restriction endonuclease subunit M [Enterovibrio norvegicus]